MSSADPPHRSWLHWDQDLAERWARNKQSEYTTQLVVVPLYRQPPQPRGWLTEEELEAIDMACQVFNGRHAGFDQRYAAKDVLSNLLARSSPPEVVRPKRWDDMRSTIGDQRDAEWVAANAAAGVAVKEVQ
jgi:predicted DNA-binding transcriptional regulator YafY